MLIDQRSCGKWEENNEWFAISVIITNLNMCFTDVLMRVNTVETTSIAIATAVLSVTDR